MVKRDSRSFAVSEPYQGLVLSFNWVYYGLPLITGLVRSLAPIFALEGFAFFYGACHFLGSTCMAGRIHLTPEAAPGGRSCGTPLSQRCGAQASAIANAWDGIRR